MKPRYSPTFSADETGPGTVARCTSQALFGVLHNSRITGASAERTQYRCWLDLRQHVARMHRRVVGRVTCDRALYSASLRIPAHVIAYRKLSCHYYFLLRCRIAGSLQRIRCASCPRIWIHTRVGHSSGGYQTRSPSTFAKLVMVCGWVEVGVMMSATCRPRANSASPISDR